MNCAHTNTNTNTPKRSKEQYQEEEENDGGKKLKTMTRKECTKTCCNISHI